MTAAAITLSVSLRLYMIDKLLSSDNVAVFIVNIKQVSFLRITMPVTAPIP